MKNRVTIETCNHSDGVSVWEHPVSLNREHHDDLKGLVHALAAIDNAFTSGKSEVTVSGIVWDNAESVDRLSVEVEPVDGGTFVTYDFFGTFATMADIYFS